MTDNILLLTDSYKVSHWRQYPPRTTRVYSFFESRGGQFPDVVFFGLQYFLKRYLEGEVVTAEKIAEASEYYDLHFGGDVSLFNAAGWEYIRSHHGGRLPLHIRAVREGSVVGTSNVLMTVENTDPNVPWLTNYVEGLLSQVWYPSTVATQSRAMKRLIEHYAEFTGVDGGVDFKLHDFGFRGSTSPESSALGAAAHMVNFKGTDTVPGLMLARKYYHEQMAGYSIPAAEHSTITSWGRDNEVAAYRNMLVSFPAGLVAVVSDSYDIFDACERLWGDELKAEVLARDGTLVVRPDSGDPPAVVTRVIDILGERFGTTTNRAGFTVLDPHVRVIQGDGIDIDMLEKILKAMVAHGQSIENIAFGSGGGLLQKVNRDTQKFAFKCSAIEVDGEWRDVMKDPITDPGKRSKAGRLALVYDGDGYRTVPEGDFVESANLLEPVFRDGRVLRDQVFGSVRELASLQLVEA